MDAFSTVPGLPRHKLAIFAGGALGTLARAELSVLIVHDAGTWPWATLIVNLVGAMALGLVIGRTKDGSRGRSAFGTGVCGGLTTFSTFALEIVVMFDHGARWLAAAYALASILGGLTLGTATLRLGRRR